ncbi:MAG TPA: hypothetical protein VNJ29_04035 [Candidatus Nitrosotenuis sp.]|jgi:hypothetical protein|nr:hypothetical protein [Candidatus Nitrosotenuis sp.]
MKQNLFLWYFLLGLGTCLSPLAMEINSSNNPANPSGTVHHPAPSLLQDFKEFDLEHTLQEIEKLTNKKEQSKMYYELAVAYHILPPSTSHDDQENKCWLFYQKALQADSTNLDILKIVKKYPEKFGFTPQTVYHFLFDLIDSKDTLLTVLKNDSLTLESQFIRLYFALENKLHRGTCKIKDAPEIILEDINHLYRKNPILSLPLVTAAYNSPKSTWDYPHVLDEMIPPFKHLYFIQEVKNDEELYEQSKFLYAFVKRTNLSRYLISPILINALQGTLEKIFFVLVSRGHQPAIEDYTSLLSTIITTSAWANQEWLNLLRNKQEALQYVSTLLSTSSRDDDKPQFLRKYNLELLKLLPTE